VRSKLQNPRIQKKVTFELGEWLLASSFSFFLSLSFFGMALGGEAHTHMGARGMEIGGNHHHLGI
jgi:hypothetical protein